MNRTTGIIEQRIFSAAELVRMRYDAFMADPNDPETNHKFRVSIRTLRSLVDFMAPWLKRKQCKCMLKRLKEVVRLTSRLRELDVLEALVREHETASPELVALCAREAQAERDKTVQLLQDETNLKTLEAALDAAQSLKWRDSGKKGGVKKKDFRKRYDKYVSKLRKDLSNLDVEDYELVHETRKRVKQVRYVAEQFEELLSDGAAETAAAMKAEQDRLGAMCDAEVNQEIVAAFTAREDVPENLAAELKTLLAG